MASINNSEFNTYLSQIQNLYSNCGFGQESGAGTYINSVFSFAGSVDKITNGNDEQKAAGIQSLINNIMSFVEKLASKEAKTAQKETKDNAKTATNIEKKQKSAEADLNKNVSEVTNQVEEQKGILDDALDSLDNASEELKAKQEEANSIIKQIQEKQEELANATTPEEKLELLGELQGLTEQLDVITASVADIQSSVESAMAMAEGAQEQIEASKGTVAEIQQEGQDKINEILQDGANEIQKNVNSEVKSVENKATAKAAEAAAQAASINPITGVSAAELNRVAVDQETAGVTRNAGAISNLNTVTQGIGGLNNNLNILKNFGTAIGVTYSEFEDATGACGASISVVITSIGSFVGDGGLQGAGEELQNSLKADMETVQSSMQSDSGEEEGSDKESAPESKTELATPNVKLQILEA